MKDRKYIILTGILLALWLVIIGGCGGGTVLLTVSDISGPGFLNEKQVADYSVTVTNGYDITYSWTVDPPSAGTLANSTTAKATLHAEEVTVNTKIKLTVTVIGWKAEPEVVSREITIMDTNQAPIAAAHSDNDRIGNGQMIQFYDDSTDPEGNDDIVKWEWDFDYDGNAGFDIDSDSREPRHQYDDAGIFQVQLRVTDTSGIADMLDTALEIEVVENVAPSIITVEHSRTTSETGNENEAVGLQVFFEDYSPPGGPHNVNWYCNYGYFDDHTSLSPTWYPPDTPVDCDITVEVRDEFGLSDTASIHQWVTGYPVVDNPGAPNNVIISQALQSISGGTINPADYIFPDYEPYGRVTFMSFWASWSSSCLDGIPLLYSVYQNYASENDYMHLMINIGDSQQSVSDFVDDNSYEGPYWLLDPDTAYFSLCKGWNDGSNNLPQTMVFDRDGRCRWAYVGEITWAIDMQLAIEELL
jgi:thiol-disulfide isomerase/thioredoxin